VKIHGRLVALLAIRSILVQRSPDTYGDVMDRAVSLPRSAGDGLAVGDQRMSREDAHVIFLPGQRRPATAGRGTRIGRDGGKWENGTDGRRRKADPEGS